MNLVRLNNTQSIDLIKKLHKTQKDKLLMNGIISF